MTSEAPREPLEMAIFAAWVNVPVDQVPDTFRAPTCADTMAAWKRVGEAAVKFCDQSIAAELATLRARLEIGDGLPDGIATRDATIALQDKRIAALEALLEHRDGFIVSNDLWDKYVASTRHPTGE